MKRFDHERPYEVFGRELSARIARRGLKLRDIAKKASVSESAIKASCSGTRPLPQLALRKIADLLIDNNEHVGCLVELLTRICKPYSSRTYFARGLLAPVRVGYLESYPFAFAPRGNLNNPQGLLIELLQTYFQVLRINYEWVPLNYDVLIDALETRMVDLVTGFVLDSPQRRVRATFVPLPMPFYLGVNGITSSPHIPTDLDYATFSAMISDGVKGSGKRFNLITVADEIADDYLPLILADAVVSLRETQRKVPEAIRYYTSDHPDRDVNIVFADQMTCYNSSALGLKLLFKHSIGKFRGGFLLPVYDQEWSSFIGNSLLSLLSSKLPKVGIVFNKYHSNLAPFIPQQLPGNMKTFENVGGSTRHPSDEFWSLEEWLSHFWPPEIPIPLQFQSLLRHSTSFEPLS